MYGVAFGLSILAFISDQNFLIALVSIITLALLVESIYNKKRIKDINSLLVGSFCVVLMTIFLGIYTYSLSQDKNIDFIWLEVIRFYSGAALLGGVTTAMLLGHWYLVQPGLSRKPIADMCTVCLIALLVNAALWLFHPSMISVLNGNISDGWGGTLGYMWLGSAITTLVLMFAASRALKERSYSAVMATTGLLYLAILVANGVELIPRAIFS